MPFTDKSNVGATGTGTGPVSIAATLSVPYFHLPTLHPSQFPDLCPDAIEDDCHDLDLLNPHHPNKLLSGPVLIVGPSLLVDTIIIFKEEGKKIVYKWAIPW